MQACAYIFIYVYIKNLYIYVFVLFASVYACEYIYIYIYVCIYVQMCMVGHCLGLWLLCAVALEPEKQKFNENPGASGKGIN